MGDLLLSVGPDDKHTREQACAHLRFFEDMRVLTFTHEQIWIAISTEDDSDLCAPFFTEDGKSFVAVVGNVVFEPEFWEATRRLPGAGGVACKAVYRWFRLHGTDAWGMLDGNYVVVVFDAETNCLHIVTDRCGVFPCFTTKLPGGGVGYGTHPDALALLAADTQRFDLTSMAEFLMHGRLSAPYTYYPGIQAIDAASVLTLDLSKFPYAHRPVLKYASFNFNIDDSLSVDELADILAEAIRKAVMLRRNSVFGRSALALSGGLDSRVLLCSDPDPQSLIAFCMCDRENLEYRLAKAIAEACKVEFCALIRDLDYYPATASIGVRVSGAMGSIAHNHFLGFRAKLRSLGARRLMTGCYCDYLLKGLLLDKQVNLFTRSQRLGSPGSVHYHHWTFKIRSRWGELAEERMRESVPVGTWDDVSEIGRLRAEHHRIMPLSYEADNMQRNTVLRTMGAVFPITSRDVIGVYLRAPPAAKLNNLLFCRVVRRLCSSEILAIPNSNTGASLIAPFWYAKLSSCRLSLRRRMFVWSGRTALDGSWPNWHAVLRRSKVLHALWEKPNSLSRDLFQELLGRDHYSANINAYAARTVQLFYRLLTLKLWLEQRSPAND